MKNLRLNIILCAGLLSVHFSFGQRVMIEKYDPATDISVTMGIASQDRISLDILNEHDGDNQALGQRIEMGGSGPNARFASYHVIQSAAQGIKYGTYQRIVDSSAAASYGTFNTLKSAYATSYGTYNRCSGDSDASKIGTYNDIYDVGDNLYGVRNKLHGQPYTSQYGVYNEIDPSDNGSHYGVYNAISGSAQSNHYGTYNLLTASGGGLRCAGWFRAEGGDQNFAAIFYSGHVRIGKTNTNPLFYADDNLGRIGIGTDTPGSRLEIRDEQHNGSLFTIVNEYTGTIADGISIQTGPTSNPGAANQYVLFRDGSGNIIGTVSGDGAGGVSFNTTSDRRLKQHIRTYTAGLELVQQMQPRVYERKSKPGTDEIGFIAQELQQVMPQAVAGTPDSDPEEPMMVDYSKITPVLVSAIQELTEQLDQQISLNTELLKRIEALEASNKSQP